MQIEIKSGWIEIEGYSIQTSKVGPGGAHPKNWGFSASKDGKRWTKREDFTDAEGHMNAALRSKYLAVSKKRNLSIL